MNNEMTPEKALEQVYAASRLAPLNADQHEAVRKYAEIVLKSIQSKQESTEKDSKSNN